MKDKRKNNKSIGIDEAVAIAISTYLRLKSILIKPEFFKGEMTFTPLISLCKYNCPKDCNPHSNNRRTNLKC